MGWLSSETISLLKHLLGNFLAAAVLFAVTIGLGYIEKWCVSAQMPGYVTSGVTVISFTLFVIDGIVICGTAAIVAFRLLQRTWNHD